jgi:hypothetical protein
MEEKNGLAGKIFSLLKGNGLQIKIFDAEGAETTDPEAGRRFFVANPNLMVTIDEEGNNVEFSKGASVDNTVLTLQKNIRRLADEFMMNSKIKVFGKAIEPKHFAYQAKNQQGAVMENSENISVGTSVVCSSGRFGIISGEVTKLIGNSVIVKDNKGILHNLDKSQCRVVGAVMENTAVNSHLMGQIVHLITKTGGTFTASGLVKNIKGTHLGDVQKALNKLVTDGKIATNGQTDAADGSPFYCAAVDEAIMESFSKMFGSARTSQQTLENVRLLVRHKTPVDENVRGARSRQISAIFLECNGERFRFPHTYLPGARAMAQHMAHGGIMGDKVGAYIAESTGNLLKLQSFNRYVTTNRLINEDSSSIVDTVKENIETIRTELRKLTGSKTYETVKARLETFEREALSEDDTSGLKDLFTIRRFDEKFEGVLPIIKQMVQEKDTFHKRIEEAAAIPVMIRREAINTTPMFEFASENARLGFKLNELALRIVENEELAGFVNKVGTKLCKEGIVNDFEKAVITQVLENLQIVEKAPVAKKEIKESTDLSVFFDKYILNFY